MTEQSAEAEAGTDAENMSIESAGSGSGIGVAKTEAPDQTNSEEPTREQPQKNCCGVRTGFIRYLLRQLSGPMIDSTIGNVVVVVLFLGILTMGIMGCVFQTDDNNLQRFFPEGSYAWDWINTNNDYFSVVGGSTSAYTRNPSYWQLNAEMDSLMYSTLNNSWIVSSTVSSWNHNFQQWTTANSLTYATEQDWYSGLNQFLASNSGRQFRRNLIFSNNSLSGSTSNPLIIARISCNHVKKTSSGSEVDAMDAFRDTVDQYDVSLYGSEGVPFAYGQSYEFYEGAKVIGREFQRNVALALLGVFVVIVILIPSPVVAGMVFLTITCTILEVVGYLHWWGLYLDNITVVMSIVSIGIAVDYAAHVGHGFMCNTGTAQERAIQALVEMGACVWHGFFSTFLAIVVLAPSKSYVFSSFFKALFLASVLGVFHGLAVLPVLLKLMGGDNIKLQTEEPETQKNELAESLEPKHETGQDTHETVVVVKEETKPDGQL